MKNVFLAVFIFLNFLMMAQTTVRYVALGDSYTIGTGASEKEAWPAVLTKHLKENKINIELIANAARNGWTTENVLQHEFPVLDKSNATFVTLLIGTNDYVQGVSVQTYQKNLIKIIDHIQAQLPDKRKLILLTLPDYSVTPGGAKYAVGRNVSEGIKEYNKVILEEAKKRNLKTVDLFTPSKEMGKDKTLVAPDGLHPSAKGYAAWEKLIYPVALELLK
ncbi:MAG TPA: SGNH/GDSL hydrolase family protein [Bacteroidia bacterium]|jgi:lysophospholipase L1-like esterase